MRRWKRPGQLLTSLPNEMVIWAKEKNENYMIFPALRPWLVVWPGFEPSSSHWANSSGALPTKLTGKQLAKLEGATQYNQVEIHTCILRDARGSYLGLVILKIAYNKNKRSTPETFRPEWVRKSTQRLSHSCCKLLCIMPRAVFLPDYLPLGISSWGYRRSGLAHTSHR